MCEEEVGIVYRVVIFCLLLELRLCDCISKCSLPLFMCLHSCLTLSLPSPSPFLPSLPSAGEMQEHQQEEAPCRSVRPSFSPFGHQDKHAFYWF